MTKRPKSLEARIQKKKKIQNEQDSSKCRKAVKLMIMIFLIFHYDPSPQTVRKKKTRAEQSGLCTKNKKTSKVKRRTQRAV